MIKQIVNITRPPCVLDDIISREKVFVNTKEKKRVNKSIVNSNEKASLIWDAFSIQLIIHKSGPCFNIIYPGKIVHFPYYYFFQCNSTSQFLCLYHRSQAGQLSADVDIIFFFFLSAYLRVFAAPPQSWVTPEITISAWSIIHSFRLDIANLLGTFSIGGYSLSS